jgi:hypothetical protein
MVLSATKKTSSISSITNQYQGGGNNKPGLFPQVGRSSWTSVAFDANAIPDGNCCKRTDLTRLNFTRTTPPVSTTIHVPRLTPKFG